MTSAGGGGAMAAAPGPRAGTGAEAGAEAERRRLLRAVTRLQVRDGSGAGEPGRGKGKAGAAAGARPRSVPLPVAVPVRAGLGGTAGPARFPWLGFGSSAARGPCQACARGFLLRRRLRSVREEFEAVVLEIEGDLRQLRWSGRVLQRPRFGPELGPGPAPAGFVPAGAAQARGSARPAQPSPGNPSDPGEAAENETIPRKTREEAGAGGAERGGSWGNTPPPRGTPPNPPNLGGAAAPSPEEEGGALEGDRESSESPGIPEELRGLPRWELQARREQLLLELLWVQQAVASRKQFLLLKQKLGIPHGGSSIPEFLHCWGEALELLQQQQHP
ncbi:IQ domain-containing protein C [Anomalospiza imberbis]|uniref:IQ domain-containing protein C n=1 Tax=Anomalospiza imberbis TaxID=187417 RepID=UPI00358E3F8B